MQLQIYHIANEKLVVIVDFSLRLIGRFVEEIFAETIERNDYSKKFFWISLFYLYTYT